MQNEDFKELKMKLGEGEPMRVPEGYFESFSSRLQDRITAQYRKEEIQVVTAWQRIRPKLVPVIAFAGVAAIALIFTLHRFSDSGQLVIPQAQVSELIEYSGVNFDEDQLIEVLGNNTELEHSSAHKSQILEYLSVQNIDLTDVSLDL